MVTVVFNLQFRGRFKNSGTEVFESVNFARKTIASFFAYVYCTSTIKWQYNPKSLRSRIKFVRILYLRASVIGVTYFALNKVRGLSYQGGERCVSRSIKPTTVWLLNQQVSKTFECVSMYWYFSEPFQKWDSFYQPIMQWSCLTLVPNRTVYSGLQCTPLLDLFLKFPICAHKVYVDCSGLVNIMNPFTGTSR